MIQCPNCNEQIADDSAHCGFCGHQLKGGASKTMFGMAPVTADDLDVEAVKKATQEAKEQANQGAGGLPRPTLPKPGGPSPTAPGSGAGASSGLPKPNLPKPGGLNIPRPGSDSAPLSGESASLSGDAGVPADQAKTEAMAPISPSDVPSSAPSTPDASAPSNATPMWGEQPAQTPTPEPTAAGMGASGDDAFSDDGDDWGAQQQPDAPQVSSDGSWGDSPSATPQASGPQVSSDDSWGAQTATAEPGAQAGGWDNSMPTDAPNAPMATTGGAGGGGFPAGGSDKDDKQKMILYIAAAVGGLFFLCCVISIILNFVLG